MGNLITVVFVFIIALVLIITLIRRILDTKDQEFKVIMKNSMKRVIQPKCYVLLLAKNFPASHNRAGELTDFKKKLLRSKKHTIRNNYEHWKRIVGEVNSGIAYISIRQWSGLPYRSKQEEIVRLHDTNLISIQHLQHTPQGWIVDGQKIVKEKVLARNDGLKLADFQDWFRNKKDHQSMALIQFTKFKY